MVPGQSQLLTYLPVPSIPGELRERWVTKNRDEVEGEGEAEAVLYNDAMPG